MPCASGSLHTVTLSNNGTLFSFGSNHHGQLGLGYYSERKVPIVHPTPIPNLPKIRAVSCGYYFTVCVDEEGYMWSFGQNTYNQLGTGNTTNSNVPQKIDNIPPVQSISCGFYHTLFITNDYNLWSFGTNECGQLCLENLENQLKPKQTSFEDIVEISAGAYHSLFQNRKGEIFGCGMNILEEHSVQINVSRIPNQPPNIIQFSCGYYHSLFLDDEGHVFSMQENSNLSLWQQFIGISKKKILQQIQSIPSIQKISCVGFSFYLLDFDGNVWSFGGNDLAQLGHGDKTKYRGVPEKIPALKNIKQISYGSTATHFLAQDSENKIYAMGGNSHGQLGTLNIIKYINPQEIPSKNFAIWGSAENFSHRAKSARK